jgi:uncharacterized membrane protein
MDPVLFQATIIPHRSLSRRGMCGLVGLMVGCTAVIVLRVWLAGAWPVMGFSVVEVGLALALLRLNVRRARASELVLLTEGALSVTRTSPAGRRTERRLPVAWLNVLLEERPGQVPRLLLTERDTQEEIAAALGEEEKRDLARVLHEVLWGMRNPIFDNPQLREPTPRPDPSP